MSLSNKYIALLRGINVGGHSVKMETLRALVAELGFANVSSYIQTGNIFFESNENDQAVLTSKIERHLHEHLGYTVPTFVRSINELQRSMAAAPFKQIALTPETRHFVIFISHPLPKSVTLPLTSPQRDLVILKATAGEMFVLATPQKGRPSQFAYFEREYDLVTTGRFYHTMEKIMDAAKAWAETI